MKLFEKIICKFWPDFKQFSTEEKQNYLTIFGHIYISSLLAYGFMSGILPILITIFLLIVNLIVLLICDSITIYCTVFCLTIPLPIANVIVFGIIYHKFNKDKDIDEAEKWLCDKIRNIWFRNYHVISKKDWLYIKKNDKDFYNFLRSSSCNNRCYYTTLQLAKALQDPDIKILWIGFTVHSGKFGHAVLEKNQWIYDTNLRRTYKKSEYLKAGKAEIFAEISIDAYQIASDCTMLGWEEFGKWCQKHNVTRCV